MRTDRVVIEKRTRRLRTGGVWPYLLAGLFTMAMAVRLGDREVLAQSSAAQEATPAQNGSQASAAGGSSTEAPAAVQPAKAESHDAPMDPKKKEIVDQSANLLKLANSLKSEVDKTTADTLSVLVVKHADEIEKLAHKMRTK